jgi:hypothetical protein
MRHLLCIAAAQALLAPTVPRAAQPLRMGVEVGGGIKTVSQTIAAFESNYPRPVATLWRSAHKSTSLSGARAADLARSSGEEPASPRHRAGVASMA